MCATVRSLGGLLVKEMLAKGLASNAAEHHRCSARVQDEVLELKILIRCWRVVVWMSSLWEGPE